MNAVTGLPTTGANVHLSRVTAVAKATRPAVAVVMVSDEPNEDEFSQSHDARDFTVRVVGIARTEAERDQVGIEIEAAMAALYGSLHEGLGRIDFDEDGESGVPIFEASHEYVLKYRVEPAQPSQEA